MILLSELRLNPRLSAEDYGEKHSSGVLTHGVFGSSVQYQSVMHKKHNEITAA